MIDNLTIRCGHCKWVKRDDNGSHDWRCHRNPPTVVDADSYAVWPIVSPFDCCGCWESEDGSASLDDPIEFEK